SVINSYYYLHSNLENLGYAWYFSELIDKLIPAPERDEDVWRLVSRAFEVLDNPPAPLCVRGAEGITPLVKGGAGGLNLPNLKILFEDKLLEFLGHPSLKLWLASHPRPAACGKSLPAQRLNYLQSLAGERINASKFLAQII
ncbi:hypothetical protein KJ590_01455, partial [Patescibacteria group bacterium]|nr:hypothetical protein [Patescibacteria group bacterium]